jgi:hypothetical protein
MEEGSGTLTPVSSTTSTAVEQQTNGLLFPSSPPKSPLLGNLSPSSTLVASRRSSGNRRERRSFSSAQKFPVLEPSPSQLRTRFDLSLLWILQTVTWLYISIIAVKNRLTNFISEIWYNWRAWPMWGKYMIQRDIAGFRKIPRHVAAILDQRKSRRSYDSDEAVRRTVELGIWCACAGISIITIYEPTGMILGN